MTYKRQIHNVDQNQKAITDALSAVGASCVDLSTVGGGVPDLYVEYPPSKFARLVEIKNPATRGKLNKRQVAWHRMWRGQAPLVVETVDDMLRALWGIATNPCAPCEWLTPEEMREDGCRS